MVAPGSLMVVGFDGTEADDATLRFLEDERIGGAILFRRNVQDAAQVAALVGSLRQVRPDLLVGIDEEGGKVRRLSGDFTTFPSMDLVGRAGSAELAEQLGAALAAELRAVGVNWDFAPVLDVDSNPDNPVIGPRALSRDPAEVARLGTALIRGLQAGGVAACAKHFPGHGDTDLDSHLALPAVDRDRATLDEVELRPFRAAIDAGVASVMSAHVVYAALDAERPATLSPAVLGDLLRDELGFGGVVVTDDLEMRAVADGWEPERLGVASLEAGADALLVCERRDVQRAMLDGLRRALDDGTLGEPRLRASEARLRALAGRFAVTCGPPDPGTATRVAGAGRDLVRRIEERAGPARA